MKKIPNPFPTSGYYGAEYFCDRITETEKILHQLENGHSITLVSVRRMGKTGLINHVIGSLPKNWIGIYSDILWAETQADFLNILVTAMVNSVPEKSTSGKKIWNFIKSLRPSLTFDSLTGTPQLTLDIKPAETSRQIETVFRFLEEQPGRILLAIDEFQQILSFPEKNTDAWLRSRIQQLKNVQFIFSGSRQHLMTELFTASTRPFFRSTQFLKLDRIDPTAYKTFIVEHFNKGKKKLTGDIAGQMLEWANHHTYYVQLICNRVYSRPEQTITEQVWAEEANILLREQESVFYNYRDLLTQSQWLLLKAIASEGKVHAPTKQDFLARYSLPGSATVIQSLRALMKKELVYSDHDADGKLFYSVYDVLFQRWIQKNNP